MQDRNLSSKLVFEEIQPYSIQTDQVTDQVKSLLAAFEKANNKTLGASELMIAIGLSHRPTFRQNYLHPALEAKLIEMTIPDKPNSSNQKYRLTAKGKHLAKMAK